jgi:hypothetical protein
MDSSKSTPLHEIKMDPIGMDWIRLAYDRDQWRALVIRSVAGSCD